MKEPDFFSMQRLLLDQNDIKKIKNSTISIAGIGGIGSFVFEFLIRNGFSNFKIADFDVYDPSNVRQLFMTKKTIGCKKIDVAVKRALEINPKLNIDVYKKGINQFNFYNFCENSDIICAQTDRITSQILLYIGAQTKKIPLLHAGRAIWPNKHLVTLSFYDYRKSNGKFDFDSLNINKTAWGVSNLTLLKKYVNNVIVGEEDINLINKIERKNKEYKKKSFLEHIKNGDTGLLSKKDKNFLLEMTKKFPNDFYKMAITPELCSISGSLLTTAVKNIILDYPVKNMAIDLYNGKIFENYITH